MGLGMFFGLICLLFVGNLYGVVVGLALAGVIYYAGWQLDDEGAASILLFLAVQSILASFHSLFILVRASRNGRRTDSDAEKMQHLTAVPALFWALFWCLIAVLILVWSITVAYRDLPLR
jgi:Peptidase M50B-like